MDLYKPRIAYFLQMFGIGGMPKWLYRLSGQISSDFDIYFVATHSEYFLPSYAENAQLFFLPPQVDALARFLREKEIDIVQIANLNLYKEAALRAGTRVIIERVDGVRGGVALTSKQGLDAVIASTRGIEDRLQELIEPNKIFQIYNGIDLDTNPEIHPERFGFGNDDVIVGRTSRLAFGKNISLLIEAIIEIRKNPKYKKVRLVICGGDTTQKDAVPIMAELKKQAKPLGDSVVFAGDQDNPQQITAGFDIATCTSFPNNEGIPNSLLEAMSISKPIVSSAVDDIPEIVIHGSTGLLFASGELSALVHSLKLLIDNTNLRVQLGENGRRLVEEHFNLQNQASAYHDLYSALLSQKAALPK